MQVQGIDDDLMVLLRNKLTTRKQQLFLESFAVYLKYNDAEDFVIDLSDVFQTVGFTRKDNAMTLIKKKLIEDVDYKSFLLRRENLHGGRPAMQVMLTVNGFKQMCMLANTDAARQVRDYYISMEGVLHKFTKMQLVEQQRVFLREKEAAEARATLLLTEKEAAEARATLLLTEKEAAEAHATLLLTEKEAAEAELQQIKQRVYEEVVKLDRVYINQEVSEIGTGRHKVGKTFYEKKREGQLRTGAAQGSEMVYVRETSNAVIIENVIAVALKRYHIAREHYQCRLEHTRAIIDIACTVVDTLASSFKFIGRDELYQKVIDMLHEGSDVPSTNTSSSSESQAISASVSTTARGLREPSKVKEATFEYQSANDDVRRFMVDCMSEVGGAFTSVAAAYSVYSCWALNHTPGAKLQLPMFTKLVQRDLRKPVSVYNHQGWKGVRIEYNPYGDAVCDV
jgi:phage anti-repressor protein